VAVSHHDDTLTSANPATTSADATPIAGPSGNGILFRAGSENAVQDCS
jgi:hypothetical protein